MNYQLELKQIVGFPRCRIYRDFIRQLTSNKNIRTNGSSFLFYLLVLCSYANYSSSYRRIENCTYFIGPGEWICTISELRNWFRCRFQHQALSIMNWLEKQNYISYSIHGNRKTVKYRIIDWPLDNTVLEYNYPCKKDDGFFFFPIDKVHELINLGKCSEMDILLDLFIHAIYNDPSVTGSMDGPVVYYRNHTGNPLTSYQSLADRWGQSKATVARVLNKLERMDFITRISFRGKHGSMIYLNNYLSVMFEVSDIMIDKEEVAMHMKLPIHISEKTEPWMQNSSINEQISVSKNASCVPVSHMKLIIRRVAEMLNAQGLSCCKCPETQYILSHLSACKEKPDQFTLNIICPYGNKTYHFILVVQPAESSGEGFVPKEPPSLSTTVCTAVKGGN